MEDFQIDVVLGKGPGARSLRLDLPRFTLVAATTRTGLITSPLRDRFGFAARLDFYAADELRAITGPNVLLTGWLPDAERDRWLSRAGAYVQASRHEGFGMSVAEAMLAGAMPVVTGAGALPEVVGDAGEILPDASPAAIAAGVERALGASEELRRRARERVLREFSLDQRERGLVAVVEQAMRVRSGQPRH
jgi:glycosyltransferase involved in cell wall biosynthesis